MCSYECAARSPRNEKNYIHRLDRGPSRPWMASGCAIFQLRLIHASHSARLPSTKRITCIYTFHPPPLLLAAWQRIFMYLMQDNAACYTRLRSGYHNFMSQSRWYNSLPACMINRHSVYRVWGPDKWFVNVARTRFCRFHENWASINNYRESRGENYKGTCGNRLLSVNLRFAFRFNTDRIPLIGGEPRFANAIFTKFLSTPLR